jgi:anti-sigma factor RsiW
MCEFSGKLISWLDRELPAEEAAELERHLEDCSECRSGVDAYKRVSAEFDAYCDAAMELNSRRGAPRWTSVAAAAGAVAALVALFLVLPRTHIEQPAFHPPRISVADSPAIVASTVPASVSPAIQRVHRRQAVATAQTQNASSAPVQNQNAYLLPDEPMIQIAIPADEMFPPGAVPEGIHFVADLTIAADGSAERLSLRPRLAAFERRTTLP